MRTACLLALPVLAPALRLPSTDGLPGSDDPEIQQAMVNLRMGSTIGFEDRMGGTMHGQMRDSLRQREQEWPEQWATAYEHARFIAHRLDNETLQKFVNAYSGDPKTHYTGMTMALPEYNIPALKMQHAIPGWQARDEDEASRVTSFPSYLALAASWDKYLVYEVAEAIAEEFKTLGANVMLGPAVNIHRATQHDEEFDSLSGEDPTLGSVLVRAWILGAQTHGIMTVPKYFGKAEQTSLHFENSSANLTSWDIYYPPFETAIDCGAAGVMCASHEVNGLWSCRDQEMLERDLKGIMGFHGMVVSDVNSAREYFPYASSFEKGLDLAISEDSKIPTSDHMLDGMRNAASRVLASIWRMRLEEKPAEGNLTNNARAEAHSKVAKVAAGSGIVLVKNEEALLPLTPDKVKKVAIFGPAAKAGGSEDSTDYFSGVNEEHVPRTDYMTPYHGLWSHGIDKGLEVISSPEGADVCVVIGGSKSHLARWNLDPSSLDAIDLAVKKCKKTVVLVEISGAIMTPWRDQVQSIAVLFHSGEETGFSWAATLFGDCSPSGKLPISFPLESQEMPTWWNEAVPSYWSPDVKFAFPFGHGLSYADFVYLEPKQKPRCPYHLCVVVTVLNNSTEHSGAEVVQAYFRLTPNHPVVLRGFYKTQVLKPGASEKVVFPFTYRDISLYHDIDGHTEAEASWTPVREIEVLFGSSSRDIRHRLTAYPKWI